MTDIERRAKTAWLGPERRKVWNKRAGDIDPTAAPLPDPVELQSRLSLLRLQRDDIDRQIAALRSQLVTPPAATEG